MHSTQKRQLLVIADDIGIGPDTTTGILQLGAKGIVTGSVLIVNSPYAEDAVARWHNTAGPPEVGWHPAMTIDAPLAAPSEVPSLVRPDGTFWPLSAFMKRWLFGQLNPAEVELELRMQLRRFRDLVGHWPTFINWHQHVGIFWPIGEILMRILTEVSIRPYIRRVREPWSVIGKLGGARLKRIFLGTLGRRLSGLQKANGFPGNDWLAGIAHPANIESPDFFVRWLRAMPGNTVELMCHPGLRDQTLVGRDCTETDGLLQQRVNEMRWLQEPSFLDAVQDAGFRLAYPSEMVGLTGAARCA